MKPASGAPIVLLEHGDAVTPFTHDPSDAHFSVEDFLAVTAADEEMRRELRAIFLDESPRLLARVQASLSAGHADDVADTAHALKSLVAAVGGRRAFGLADLLERDARSGRLDGDAVDALADALLRLGTLLTAFIEGEAAPC